MKKRVVDASTVLAFLANEPGSDIAREHCKGALISAVNLTEVLQKAIERDSLAVTQAILRHIDLQVVPHDAKLALAAAKLQLQTKGKGVSLADRACLALGIVEGSAVVTGDQKWESLGLDVELIFFRQWQSTVGSA